MTATVVNKADSSAVIEDWIDVALPGSLVTGNWLVMFLGYYSTAAPSGLTGWAQRGIHSVTDQMGGALYVREIDGTESSPITVNGFGFWDDCRTATVVQVSGTDGWDAASLAFQTIGGAATTLTVQGSTAVADDALLLRFLFSETTANTVTWSWDGSTSAVADHWSAVSGGFYGHMAIRSEVQATNGASPARVVTRSAVTGSQQFVSATLSMTPVAAVTTPSAGLLLMFPTGPTTGAVQGGETLPTAVAEFLFPETTGTAVSTIGPYTLTPADSTSWDDVNERAAGPFTAPLGLGPNANRTDWSITFTLATGSTVPAAGQFVGLVCHNGGIHIDWTGNQAIEVYLGSTAAVTPTDSIVAGGNYRIAITHTGGTAIGAVTKVYINDVEVVSTAAAVATAAVNLSGFTRIGGAAAGCLAIGPLTQYGWVDDVRSFDVCLTAEQVELVAGGGAPPPPGVAAFTGDYSTGDFTQWWRMETIGGLTPTASYIEAYPADVIPDAERGSVARFEVRTGDSPYPPITKEGAEVSADIVGGVDQGGGTEGQEVYYRFSTKFDAAFPSGAGQQITNRWRPLSAALGSGSPVLFDVGSGTADHWCLVVQRHSAPGALIDATVVWETPIDVGVWHDIVMQVVWSASDSIGKIRLWHNDERQTLDDGGGPTQTLAIRTLVPTDASTFYREGVYGDAF